MMPIDVDYDIQSDTPGTIPCGVLSQRGGDVSHTRSMVRSRCRMAEVPSVRKCTCLLHLRVILLPSTPPWVIAELPYVKLCLLELDINGCCHRGNDLRFSKGDTEHTKQRTDHGAITLRLHSLGKQQAQPGAILRHCRSIFSFYGSHMKNLPVHEVDTSSCSAQGHVTMLSLKTARAYAKGHI